MNNVFIHCINKLMPRTGPRPHVWKIQGEIPHQQYCAWLQMKAQASYRGESWQLTFEDFQWLWQDHWHLKGRASNQYCLTRTDPKGAWHRNNVTCTLRLDHIRRQRLYKKLENQEKRKWQTSQEA